MSDIPQYYFWSCWLFLKNIHHSSVIHNLYFSPSVILQESTPSSLPPNSMSPFYYFLLTLLIQLVLFICIWALIFRKQFGHETIKKSINRIAAGLWPPSHVFLRPCLQYQSDFLSLLRSRPQIQSGKLLLSYKPVLTLLCLSVGTSWKASMLGKTEKLFVWWQGDV